MGIIITDANIPNAKPQMVPSSIGLI
jgi:hypothetical protein